MGQQILEKTCWTPNDDFTNCPQTVSQPLSGPNSGASRPRMARLAHTIETEIIPRLVLARRPAFMRAAQPVGDGRRPGEEDVEELVGAVLARDAGLANNFVESVRSRGVSVETVYLHLLAPTAQRLGKLWDEDLINFTQVTLGLGHLQQVLHDFSAHFQSGRGSRSKGPRALFLPLPGEQHTFGLSMVCEFFSRAGWNVECAPNASGSELTAYVRDEWFAVCGMSVGSERHLESVASHIRAIRRASRNRAIGVMVGGPIFVAHPEYARQVGADATAADACQAAEQAHGLLSLLVTQN